MREGRNLNVGKVTGRKDLTRRQIRTTPLFPLEDACRETAKTRNMRSRGNSALSSCARARPGRCRGVGYGCCRSMVVPNTLRPHQPHLSSGLHFEVPFMVVFP